MAKYLYPNGKAQLVSERLPLRGSPPEMGFHQTILNAYKEVEADGKMRGPYGRQKDFIKQVHEDAIARETR